MNLHYKILFFILSNSFAGCSGSSVQVSEKNSENDRREMCQYSGCNRTFKNHHALRVHFGLVHGINKKTDKKNEPSFSNSQMSTIPLHSLYMSNEEFKRNCELWKKKSNAGTWIYGIFPEENQFHDPMLPMELDQSVE